MTCRKNPCVSIRLGVLLTVLASMAIAEAEGPPATAGTEAPGFEKSTFTLDDGGLMNCYYRDGGGTALVLVPGTWGGVWRFESLIAALPKNLPIAVVTLCWQEGNTPPSLDMSITQQSDLVLRAIENLGIERFVISGHSIGGMIAVEIAGRKLPGLAGAIPMEGWTHHTVVKTAFRGDVTINLSPEEEVQRQKGRARGLGHLSREEIKAIGTIWRGWNGYAGLERSTVPLLEIWGDRGRTRPDREALQIPTRNNIEIAWITDASHSVLLEDPAAVASLVAGFMKKLR